MAYKVTIGMPFYRSRSYIRQALMSALSQSFPSIEFLLVDDCGGDGSAEVVSDVVRHHPRAKDVRVIAHPCNQGVSASRNEIIDEAQGEYLYFMDSDDLISEDAIALLMEQAREYQAEVVFGSYEKIEVSGERTAFQYPSLHLLEKDELASFAYRKYAGLQASACNYLVKTSLLRSNHLRFIATDYWEDLVFTFDLVPCVSRAVLLPDVTYSYCCREHSLSNYQRRDRIPKAEIMKNVAAIEHLKQTSRVLYNKVYFPGRCYNIVMTDFYIACNILGRRGQITPYVTNREIRQMMSHPATLRQICSFGHARLRNLYLYLLGKMPPFLCVIGIRILRRMKKLA